MKLSRSFLNLTLVFSLAMMLFASKPVTTTLAYTDGPADPGVGTNLAGIGTDAWLTPANITTPGDPYATIQLTQHHISSNYLVGSDYGFSIPDGVEILGIEVSINRMFSGRPNVVDNVVRLTTTGGLVGDNKANPDTLPWPTAFGTATYGGPTDLWGAGLTAEDINSADFGVALAILRDNNGNQLTNVFVDTMQVTVYYSYASSMQVNCGGGTPETAYGDAITCVATVTRAGGVLTPTGTVDWSSDGSGLFNSTPCTLAGSDGVAACSVTYTPNAVGSGSHLISADYSGDDFFASSTNNQALMVSSRPVTVTADPQTKTFGDLDPVFTFQVTQGLLVFNDTFTGTLTRDPGEDAGQYAILQGSLALNLNYDLTYLGNFLSIVKANPSCALLNYNVTYDGNPHIADGSCTGVNNELLNGLDLTGTSHINAGIYSDTWSFTDVTGNYNDITGTITNTIAKAEAVCVVTAYNVIYDGDAHTAEGTCTGVLSETLEGLDLSETTHTNIGSYNDPWSFIDVTGNYSDTSDTVDNFITGTRLLLPLVTR